MKLDRKQRCSQLQSWLLAWLAIFTACGFVAPATAHEVWIETAATGQPGQAQEVHVCWGHSGHRQGGESLASQQPRLTAWYLGPNAARETLPLTLKADHFETRFIPPASATYQLVAQLQVGIIDREFHGLPPKTRIVMTGKTLVRGGEINEPTETESAMDLDITPQSPLDSLRPGGVFAAKITFKNKPVGGPGVAATLSTLGTQPFPQDPEVEGLSWSVKNTPQPNTGEVRFPLITAGRHILSVRYTDETPSTYEGDLDFASQFSHLRKGETCERTLHVVTLTFDVSPR